MKTGFNIRLWFGVAGLGLIGLIYLVSAQWVAHFITRSMLERESEVSQEMFQSIVLMEGDAIFGGVAPANRSLVSFVEHVVNTPGVLRANIYSADRQVLWSSERQLIGRRFNDNAELEEALAGRRVTEIHVADDNKGEHVAMGQSGRFIEAYLPMRSSEPDRRVLGVIEFYKFPTALNATIGEARRMIWMLATGAALLLFLTLFWIVQRGALQIERQQKLLVRLESFAMIGELASAIAHSLRNPMAAIRSSAELWRYEQPTGQAGPADDVIREVDRMDGYVRDLLLYARPQPGSMRSLDPLAIVDMAVAKRNAALQRHGISVKRTDHRVLVSESLIDPVLFEHAVTSIIDNAIEAMPDGGTLAISVADGDRGRELSLEIADNGPGIAPEALKSISEAYFTTKSRGLGLGLALARGVIERWNGSLAISSNHGSGTCVVIKLTTVRAHG